MSSRHLGELERNCSLEYRIKAGAALKTKIRRSATSVFGQFVSGDDMIQSFVLFIKKYTIN